MKVSVKDADAMVEVMKATHSETCGKCFCADLCIFLLMRTGVATTCEDFQKRVQKVIDRNKEA